MNPTDAKIRESMVGNLRDLAAHGSPEQINVVVQYQDKRYYIAPQSGVDRFSSYRDHRDSVNKRLDAAVLNEKCGGMPRGAPEKKDATDFSSGSAIQRFVTDGLAHFPAKQSALIIGSHGSGFRADATETQDASSFRAVAGTNAGERLYNSDLQSALERALLQPRDPHGPLHLIGFDVCLMSSFEVAFGLRSVANVMVASESNSLISGWRYGRVMDDLYTYYQGHSGGSVAPTSLAQQIRANYSAQLIDANSDLRDLAITDLTGLRGPLTSAATAPALPLALHRVGSTLASSQVPIEQIVVGRSNCNPDRAFYWLDAKSARHGISADIGCVCANLDSGTVPAGAATALCDAIKASQLALEPQYQDSGLSIYFPDSPSVGSADSDRWGYLVGGGKPPAFVNAQVDEKPNGWVQFIRRFVSQ